MRSPSVRFMRALPVISADDSEEDLPDLLAVLPPQVSIRGTVRVITHSPRPMLLKTTCETDKDRLMLVACSASALRW